MYPHGVIYKAGTGKKHGGVRVAASTLTKLVYSTLRGIGAGLIGFAVISLLFSLSPIVSQEFRYFNSSLSKKNTSDYQVETIKARDISSVQEEARSLGLDSYFSIFVPKIDARSKVIANVDPADEQSYQAALKEGVAHARGTYFPGQGKTIYMFAHSTDSPLNINTYNAVFYLLRELESGDDVIVFFADRKYVYEVTDKVVVEAGDTNWLVKDFGGETLILQTCWPPGTSWRRLMVKARPKDVVDMADKAK